MYRSVLAPGRRRWGLSVVAMQLLPHHRRDLAVKTPLIRAAQFAFVGLDELDDQHGRATLDYLSGAASGTRPRWCLDRNSRAAAQWVRFVDAA